MHNDLKILNDLTDAELITRAQSRDEAAFSELMSRWTPHIWRIIVSKSRQHRDAEEIHTDIWMAVWENIDGLQKIDSFGAWLRRITYNACNRYYSSDRRSRDEIPQSDADLAEHIDQEARHVIRNHNYVQMPERQCITCHIGCVPLLSFTILNHGVSKTLRKNLT